MTKPTRMTRKDFEFFAETQRQFLNLPMTDEVRAAAIKSTIFICDELAKTNPRFDRAKFLAACGVAEGAAGLTEGAKTFPESGKTSDPLDPLCCSVYPECDCNVADDNDHLRSNAFRDED